MIKESLQSSNALQECSRCLLTTGDVIDITFDSTGVCQYCQYYDQLRQEVVIPASDRQTKLEQLTKEIWTAGKSKPYDCIIGVSGGIDSTYVAYLAKKKMGLRPLAVHLDYGWNSEIAVMNIHHVVNKLNIDLLTFVVDWEEIKDIQLALLQASVVDIELVNDFAINCLFFNTAYDKGIRYILHGGNVVTEGGALPTGWTWHKYDELNLRAIHKRFGTKRLRTYPSLSFFRRLYYAQICKIQFIGILNYVDYQRDQIKQQLINELGWKDYGGKHFESIFTRFYQGYILPKKFGIHKRKFHLSVMICSGQMTKAQAKKELETDYYSNKQQEEDYEFVLKKLNLTAQQFADLMALPVRRHEDYPSYVTRHYVWHQKILQFLSPLKFIKRLLKRRTNDSINEIRTIP